MRILVILLHILAALVTVRCQQVTPFVGQGIPPPGGTTVYVTVGLDRLIDIDDESYRFEAILFMVLTWNDPRAKPAVLASTESVILGNSNCTYLCTSFYTNDVASLCCDGMWLPQLEFLNARGFSQDRVVRYGVEFGESVNSSAVGWWAQVQGEFYTNLDFRAFPFDSQNLVIQVGYADRTPEIPVDFKQGSTALTLYLPKAGDDISGWSVQNIRMSFYNVTDEQIYSRFIDFSNPNDPLPIHPENPDTLDIFRAPLWNEGFVIYIQVDRIYIYFILTAIIPIALNVWLALLVFSVSPKHLDTRLGIIVTLFLSLTALMLVVGDVLPKSSVIVPTQQLVLLSYLILGFVGLESIILYKIVTVEKQKNIKKRMVLAKEAFTKRWNTFALDFRRAHTFNTKDGQDGIYATASKSGLGLRRRKTSNGQSGIPADITVDLPDESQIEGGQQPHVSRPLPAASPFDQAHPISEEGVSRKDIHANQENSTFGGIGDNDSDDSQRFGASAGSDFASDDNEGRPASRGGVRGANTPVTRDTTIPQNNDGRMSKMKAWFVLARTRMKEMNRERKTNPDYALYLALSVDRVVFWTTLIAYDIALIVIFAINSSYQAPIRF